MRSVRETAVLRASFHHIMRYAHQPAASTNTTIDVDTIEQTLPEGGTVRRSTPLGLGCIAEPRTPDDDYMTERHLEAISAAVFLAAG